MRVLCFSGGRVMVSSVIIFFLGDLAGFKSNSFVHPVFEHLIQQTAQARTGLILSFTDSNGGVTRSRYNR